MPVANPAPAAEVALDRIPELLGEIERLPDDAGPDSSGGPCEVSCRIPVSGRAGRRATGRLTL